MMILDSGLLFWATLYVVAPFFSSDLRCHSTSACEKSAVGMQLLQANFMLRVWKQPMWTLTEARSVVVSLLMADFNVT